MAIEELSILKKIRKLHKNSFPSVDVFLVGSERKSSTRRARSRSTKSRARNPSSNVNRIHKNATDQNVDEPAGKRARINPTNKDCEGGRTNRHPYPNPNLPNPNPNPHVALTLIPLTLISLSLSLSLSLTPTLPLPI